MRRAIAMLAAGAVAACAPLPPAPSPSPEAVRPRAAAPVPAEVGPRDVAVARHQKLARSAREAGDLATAAEHYRVLALLEPAVPAHADALRATEAAIEARVQEQLRAAATARRSGDPARAREAWLRVLLLDADNAEAARGLRELEQATMARIQADRAARVRSMDEVVANARARVATENAADLDQRLELVRSSDASIAVREARAWADANPNDRAGRAKLAAALGDRAKDVESRGQREWALALYDQAVTLGGAGQADWGKRAAALRRTLADEAYADGMRARSTDLGVAIRHLETALRYDPQHARARERLAEARAAQKKLERIAR